MKTQNCTELPVGYRECLILNLRTSYKKMLGVNIFSMLALLIFALVGHMIVPITTLINPAQEDFKEYLLKFVPIVVGALVYSALREVMHGVLMRCYGKGRKPRFGIAGPSVIAVSDAYFNRFSYLVIRFIPVLILGVVLLVLNFIVPTEWFWQIYALQLVNISTSARDLYISYFVFRISDSALVRLDKFAWYLYLPEDDERFQK